MSDAGGGWLRVQLERPGVLLLRRLSPRRAGGVAVAMFGLSLVWACSSADVSVGAFLFDPSLWDTHLCS
jgi:hypothetical protein